MLVVGLTGGIGTGKTTFAALLAERGAQIIDADLLGRDALLPGRPAWHSVVDQFGDDILAANSLDIDRKRLADVVFEDPDKLAALNAIVHPAIFKGIADRLEALQGTDEIVVLDVALLIETGLDSSVDVIVVVEAPDRDRIDRVARSREMSFGDVRARMAAQAHPRELRARADIVVVNSGSLEQLASEADRVWAELRTRSAGPP
jgi:dephospho-CoA kinase